MLQKFPHRFRYIRRRWPTQVWCGKPKTMRRRRDDTWGCHNGSCSFMHPFYNTPPSLPAYVKAKIQSPFLSPPQCVGLMMQARSRPLTLQHYPSSTGTNDVNADGGYVWTAMKVVNDAAERKSMEGLFSFRSSSGVLFLYNYYCWNIIYNVLLKDM